MDSSITEAELIEELRNALSSAGPDDAYTTSEIAELLGYSDETTRKRIRKLLRAGKMMVVRVQRASMDGRMLAVPAYKFVP